MNRKHVMVIVFLIGALMLTSVLAAGAVTAGSSKNPPIVQKLADRFNLKTEDVTKVFTEAQEERRQELQAQFEKILDQAVKDKKITEEQKTTILKKRTAIEAKQKELMELERDLRAWAEDNSIDLGLIGGFGPHRGGKGGPGGGFRDGPGLGPGPCN